MKLVIDQSNDHTETEITIKCAVIDDKLEHLISQIRLFSFSIIGHKDQRTVPLGLQDIFYFESVDDMVFIYTHDEVFETTYRLYELEALLTDSRFVRISKAVILNMEQLQSVRALLNSKYEATMKNGERQIVTRHYLPSFKAYFAMGGILNESI